MKHANRYAGWVCALAACLPIPGRAADLFNAAPAELLRTDTFSAEVNAGYLAGKLQEYVYDRYQPGGKVSQLTWDLNNTLTVGGRVAFRPLDWLSVRARGWAAVTGDGSMRDYDFLYTSGFTGPNSFSHVSSTPRTNVAKAWQADISLAAAFYQDETLALTAIGGFRHFDVKLNAKGGSYSYAIGTPYQFSGLLPNQIGIAYEQWWDAPYLGLGAAYSEHDWTFTLEGIGSPYVTVRDNDFHALRTTLFKGSFDATTMAGVNAGLEYRWSDAMSLAGRVEYQKYFLTHGDVKVLDGSTGTYSYFGKPSTGASAETLQVSVGVKAKL